MTIYKKLLTGAVAAAALASTSAYAVQFDFSNPGAVTQGGLFTVDLIASGLTTENLAGYDLDIAFDDAMLSFSSYTLGSELTDPVFGDGDLSLGESAGILNLAQISYLLDFSAQPDSFVVATLEFMATGVGATALSFNYLDATDDLGGILAATSTDLQLNVSAVPVPAAAWLFGSALLGLIGLRGRR